jgi:hypothetical protein
MALVKATVYCAAKRIPELRMTAKLTGLDRIEKAGRRGLMSRIETLNSPVSSWTGDRLPATHHRRRPRPDAFSTSISTCRWCSPFGDAARVGAGVGSLDLSPLASFRLRFVSATSCAWKARATERLTAIWYARDRSLRQVSG